MEPGNPADCTAVDESGTDGDGQPDSARLLACGQITLLPAHPPGESHSQMEGFQGEDRHNPLPHIGPSATAPN
jgi:hypothetical protein